jgi:hypothetical protein
VRNLVSLFPVLRDASAYVFDHIIWFASDELHLEEPELCIDRVKFVYHGPELLVFLQYLVSVEQPS